MKPSKMFYHRENCCVAILKNKCCMCCLIVLTVLTSAVFGIKIFLNAVLDEVQVTSLKDTLVELKLRGEFTEENFGARTQLSEEIRGIEKYLMATFTGFDYQNRPVWILPFGKWDIKKLVNSDLKKLHMFVDECHKNIFKSMTIRNSTGWILICDMDGYSYSQLASINTIKFLLQAIKKFHNVIDKMASGFVINLDHVSVSLIKILSPVIGGDVAVKIKMMTDDRAKYVPTILKQIPANQLPQQYGGSKGYRPIVVYN